ncbi:LuxR C-terminal-related transcriptional regulator [Ferrimonas balearica]|nr:LuxR C-terminal-related transcriptional regulator [Ferrimonas balearica]
MEKCPAPGTAQEETGDGTAADPAPSDGAIPLRDRVIGQLYDVALDPRRLEDFLTDWEQLTRPLRAAAPRDAVTAVPPEEVASRCPDAARLTDSFLPHFRRVRALLGQSRAAPALPAEEMLLRQLPRRAGFTVGPDLSLRAVNAPATALLGVQTGDTLSQLPLEPSHLAALEDRLRQLLAPAHDTPEAQDSESRGAAAGTAACDAAAETGEILRLRLAPSGRLVIAQMALHMPPDQPPFALVVTTLLHWPRGLGTLLRRAFGLTQAETEILRALSEARPLREIARARGRSVETVRAQIKALLAKTETRSQAELLRLVLSFDPLPAVDATQAPTSAPPPDHWVAPASAETPAAQALAVEARRAAAATAPAWQLASVPLALAAPVASAAQAGATCQADPLARTEAPHAPTGRSGQDRPRSGGMVQFSHGGGLLSPRPFARLCLPDRRRLSYLDLGAPEGRPVLWLHGVQGVCRLPARHEAAAARAGLRLMVPLRAGFGGSDPLPAGTDRLEAHCADLRALLDQLKITRLPLLSLSDDMGLACALARRDPGRISALIAVSPPPPALTPVALDEMGRWQRILLGAAHDLPELFPHLLALSAAMARRLGSAGFHSKLFAGSQADRATVQDLDFQCQHAASREILLEPSGALMPAVQEEVIAQVRHDYRADLQALAGQMPVHMLFGRQNLRTGPAQQAALEAEFPWVAMQRFDEAGELLHLQQMPALLALAASHARDTPDS